jgi:hypothetical protein
VKHEKGDVIAVDNGSRAARSAWRFKETDDRYDEKAKKREIFDQSHASDPD